MLLLCVRREGTREEARERRAFSRSEFFFAVDVLASEEEKE